MAQPLQAVPPSPAAIRSKGFWIAAVFGCLGIGVVLLLAGSLVIGLLAGLSGDSGHPPPAPPAAASASPADPAEADDFVYDSPNGLHTIAPNRIVAEGVQVTLAGIWREDQRSVTLRLGADGRYELGIGGGASGGRTKYDIVASSSSERGTWTLQGQTLTLSPEGTASTGMAEGKVNSGKGNADPPRAWAVAGVTIEYTPHGSETPRQRPGLRVTGPLPSWHYPPGDMNWVLRRAW
ncbi:MAG: hypothetical protein FD180_3042 [Planctomycetota bacterium]|nr:MAG: hypothetical protein FD180_3042 [Planctomycetota bacterium]